MNNLIKLYKFCSSQFKKNFPTESTKKILGKLDGTIEKVSFYNDKIIIDIRKKETTEELIFQRNDFDITEEEIKIGSHTEKAEKFSIEHQDAYLYIYKFINPNVMSIHINFKNYKSSTITHLEQKTTAPFDNIHFTYYSNRPSSKKIKLDGDTIISQTEFEETIKKIKEKTAKYAALTEDAIEITLENDETISIAKSKFIHKTSIKRNVLDMSWVKTLNLYGDNSIITISDQGFSFNCGNLRLWIINKTLLSEELAFIEQVLAETKETKIKITKPFKIENYKTRADLFCLLKTLIDDFDISDYSIKKYCKDSYLRNINDTLDIVLIRILKDYAGTTDKDSASVTMQIFNELLIICNGYRTDIKYDDSDVEWEINKPSLLKKYKLKIEFSEHKINEPFEIELIDLKEDQLIHSTKFEYSSNDYHDQKELINTINNMLIEKKLILAHINDGSDSFSFVLFEASKYEKLKTKYGEDLDNLVKIR